MGAFFCSGFGRLNHWCSITFPDESLPRLWRRIDSRSTAPELAAKAIARELSSMPFDIAKSSRSRLCLSSDWCRSVLVMVYVTPSVGVIYSTYLKLLVYWALLKPEKTSEGITQTRVSLRNGKIFGFFHNSGVKLN